MKQIFRLMAAALAFVAVAVSCEKPVEPVQITLQLTSDGAPFAEAGIPVTLKDAAGSNTYDATTNSSGSVSYSVMPGAYTASTTYTTSADGVRFAYTGANNNIIVAAETPMTYQIALNKVESQQIIIKELYFGGCKDNDGAKGYTNDGYVVLYNNSDMPADASNVVFTFAAPYNGNGTNKYIGDTGVLLYENDSWIPAYGAIWYFQTSVVIEPYSQVVIALFGAIDHTKTYNNSVNLSKPEYYVMSNQGLTAYTNAKYQVSDNIPASHYLTTVPFTKGNAWALSNSSPAFYIGKMSSSEVKSLSGNADAFDHTLGAGEAFNVVKFPKTAVLDCIEVWAAAQVAKSQTRFPAAINTGHVDITNQLGYSVYRNVDKAATEALPENSGKIKTGYAGGTSDLGGSTDPSGIDAEASIAAGAHIIYQNTNDSGKDFHQRKVASLKK
jgi:hypothetical protein